MQWMTLFLLKMISSRKIISDNLIDELFTMSFYKTMWDLVVVHSIELFVKSLEEGEIVGLR